MEPPEFVEAVLQPTELDKWRDVGERLWPFVRYFGLCGGCPASIQAMVDLAELLGVNPAAEIDQKTASQAGKQAIESVISHFEQKYYRKMLRKDAEAYVQELRSQI